MTGNPQKSPSAKRIVVRMAVTLLMLIGLVVCFRYCSQTVFLVVFIVTIGAYTALSLWEASRSHGNRAKWGRQEPMDEE